MNHKYSHWYCKPLQLLGFKKCRGNGRGGNFRKINSSWNKNKQHAVKTYNSVNGRPTLHLTHLYSLFTIVTRPDPFISDCYEYISPRLRYSNTLGGAKLLFVAELDLNWMQCGDFSITILKKNKQKQTAKDFSLLMSKAGRNTRLHRKACGSKCRERCFSK